jgi:DNA-binding NarL/FixJ family response regulator
MPVRAALADDSYIIREGLEQLLSDPADGIEVVAVCDDFDSLLHAVEERHPDVVVTDIRMPPTYNDEGIRLAAILRERHPEIGVVVLSNYAEPSYALALLESGSEGRSYLLKERVHDRSQLVTAIHAVAAGAALMDPKIIEPIVFRERDGPGEGSLDDLSPRERQVLALIAEGKSNSAICVELFLTKSAVEKHINSIFAKLQLSDAQDVSKRVKAALLFLSRA